MMRLTDITSRLHSLSLKTRLAVSLTLLAAAIVAGMSFHVSRVVRNDMERLISNQLTAMVNHIASDMDRKLELRQTVLSEMATAIGHERMANPGEVRSMLLHYAPPEVLFSLGGGVVDRNGTIIAEFAPAVEGRLGGKIRNVEQHKTLMNRCEPYVTPPYVAGYAARPVVLIGAPICDANGKASGVVLGVVPLSDADLFGEIARSGSGKGGQILVVSRNAHTIVAASDQKRLLRKVDDANQLVARRFREGFEGVGLTLDLLDNEFLSVSRHLEKTDWTVMASVPTDMAFNLVRKLRREIRVATLLTFALALLLLFVLLHYLLSPLASTERAVRRMADGSKSLEPLPVVRNDEIGAIVRHYNSVVEDLRKNELKLEYLSHHDALTGLPNRLLAQQRFEETVSEAIGHGCEVALLYLDVDRFKTINDALGHCAGNEIIRQIGRRLLESVEAKHIVSRMDGDEFLIILRCVNGKQEVENAMKHLHAQFSRPLKLDEREITITFSIGAAVCPEDGRDFSELYKKADSAMVNAKESGRNTMRFFEPGMNVSNDDSVMLVGQMKRALERGEFELHYQPQIDLSTGAVVGAEALVRWRHPELGMIPPGRFIPAAEESGMIVSLGAWVIQEAARQAAEWQRKGLPKFVMAVNLSSVQFKCGNLEQTLVEALDASGLAPEYLELELTESILIRDTDNVLQKVRRLKNLGFKLSIDDFGTGYSSLSYLKKFDVDKIKVDQSFVRNLASDPDDNAIVKAIIQMARSLGLATIAEGVEDQRTLDHLRLLQCTEAQGYYLSRPLPAARFAMFLETAAEAGHAGLAAGV